MRTQVIVYLALVCVVGAQAGTELRGGHPFGYEELLPEGNTTVLAVANMAYGGKAVFALGKDRHLWTVFQENKDGLPWSKWTRLTAACPSKQEPERECAFDADPAIGQNKDGRLEIFGRFVGNLDLWQMYQTDPNDPMSWAGIREPSCVDQDQKTGKWYCLCDEEEGYPKYPNKNYWNSAPVFPTSDVQVVMSAEGKLQVVYRGFDGQLYMVEQAKAGDSSYYINPQALAPGLIFE